MNITKTNQEIFGLPSKIDQIIPRHANPDHSNFNFNITLKLSTEPLCIHKDVPPTANKAAATNLAVTISTLPKPNSPKTNSGAIISGIATIMSIAKWAKNQMRSVFGIILFFFSCSSKPPTSNW